MTDVKALADGPQHRWSGWPGAWCLDCGADDPYEIAEADGLVDYVDDPAAPEGARCVISDEIQQQINGRLVCPEPGSKRCDPYYRAELARRQEAPDAE